MRYWESLRRDRLRSGTVTLNMVAEFLETIGYEIVNQPSVNASISTIASTENTRALNAIDDGIESIFIATYNGSVRNELLSLDERATSYLIVMAEGAQLPADPTKDEQRILARSIVARPPSNGSTIAQLENDIANFIISIERFSASLAQGVNSSNQYQALVDVAEEFFGNFISIVDPNNMLLAYTKHIEPIDDISRSLIHRRYHTEEMLQREREQSHLSARMTGQEGVCVFPPNEFTPAAAVTSPIMVGGNYAGYIVMACDNDVVRPGTKDTFALFVSFCDKVASLRNDIPAGRNPYAQNLLITLLSRQSVDTIFVEQQARRLALPTSGSYKLIRIVWPDDCSAQLPFFVDEICRSDPRSRVAVRYENAALVLVYADDMATMNTVATRVTNSFPANIAYKITTSEVLSSLFEIYFAYRTLKCVEKYESAILRYKPSQDDDAPIMLTFRDAFAFYWNDPLHDTSIANFAVSHMVVNDIARVDSEKHTDDLALLEAFLVNERKASTVADTHHLHRNGVLYRIKRIQERHGIDLNDHLTRQYVLACLRIRATVHGAALP